MRSTGRIRGIGVGPCIARPALAALIERKPIAIDLVWASRSSSRGICFWRGRRWVWAHPGMPDVRPDVPVDFAVLPSLFCRETRGGQLTLAWNSRDIGHNQPRSTRSTATRPGSRQITRNPERAAEEASRAVAEAETYRTRTKRLSLP